MVLYPKSVRLECTGPKSMQIIGVLSCSLEERTKSSDISTSDNLFFKIQWSKSRSFSPVDGELESCTRRHTVQITGLDPNETYFVRGAFKDKSGYGLYKLSTPECITLSAWWADDNTKVTRSVGKIDLINEMYNNLCQLKEGSFNLKDKKDVINQKTKSNNVTKHLRTFFGSHQKFSKHLKKGIYLACILFCDGKLCMVNDELPPVIEVCDVYNNVPHSDLVWFYRVASNWDDVRCLQQELELKCQGNAAFELRLKLAQAVSQMQTHLDFNDLGRPHFKLILDGNGTAVFCTVRRIHDVKSVNSGFKLLDYGRLVQRKLIKKACEEPSVISIQDLLITSIPEQIQFYERSELPLPKGLYLGYFKLQSSLDVISIIISEKCPSMVPFCRIRENHHVSREEWWWLKRLTQSLSRRRSNSCDSSYSNFIFPTVGHNTTSNTQASGSDCGYVQKNFGRQLMIACNRLFTDLQIPEESLLNHRICDLEVIEIVPGVNFIMLVPGVLETCALPNLVCDFNKSKMVYLPVSVFEIAHFTCYHKLLMKKFCKLSLEMELELTTAKQSCREAFSAGELDAAKSKLTSLEKLNADMNSMWKQVRWLTGLTSYVNSKVSIRCIPIKALYEIVLKEVPGILSVCRPKQTCIPNSTKTSTKCIPAVSQSQTDYVTSCNQSASLPDIPLICNFGKLRNTKYEIRTSDSVADRLDTCSLKSVESEGTGNAGVVLKTGKVLQKLDRHSLRSETSSENGSTSSGASLRNPAFANGEHDFNVDKNSIVKILAAYETGLSIGTYVKLFITPTTTVRQIIELVVRQLNMVVILKGIDHPVYPAESMGCLCLVALYGTRERCLRDDYRLMQLQPPWNKSRLYIRKKNDVLAAIELNSSMRD